MMWSLRLCAPVLLLIIATASAEDRPAAEKPHGLQRRIPWNDSRVVGSPDPPLPYKTVRAFPGLTILRPATLAPEPGTDRLFIISHLNHWAGPGKLLAVRDDQDASSTEVLLDIDGLPYGLAFHPDYRRNGYHLHRAEGQDDRAGVALHGQPAAAASRRPGFEAPDHRVGPPTATTAATSTSATTGSSTSPRGTARAARTPTLTGQRIDDLQGSVLRIDVDHPEPGRNYGVPRDNPFVDRPGARPEIWAYGLRNPWRLSYDQKSGQLWVGNNGQDAWEQVYLIQKGGNYGWSLVEGGHVFLEGRQAGPDPILPPAADHPHSEARSMTGGRVYRGTRLPELDGVYVYGDWSTGHVWGIRHDGKKATWHRELVDTPFNITGFGTDHAGELYIIDQTSGGFYRLEPTSEADRPRQPFPTRLSETGLFASVAAHTPHPAAIPLRRQRPAVGRRGVDGAVRRADRAGTGPAEAAAQRGRRPGRCPTARSWCRRSPSTGSTTPASRPASGSRPGCWSGSRGNGPATRTGGTPRRPTPSWSRPPGPARSSRCPTRPRRMAVASRPGGSRPAPSA